MKYFHALVLILILTGCATRQAGWESQTKTVEIEKAELLVATKNAKALWAKRVETEKLKEALQLFEKIHSASPADLDTLIYLTRGYYFLADSHLQDIEQKKQVYEKAAAFGEKAMATNEEFRKKIAAGQSIEESLNTLTAKEVPAIYWTAASLGKWAKASGITAALKYKTRIKAFIERVEKLQPDYFFGAAPRYWGGYYAVAPSFAGGDLKKSKKNFDRSISIAPEYLGTKVLMADVYWSKMGDKKQFENTLKEVINSSNDNHPEIGPENFWEKKKAAKLLENRDEIF